MLIFAWLFFFHPKTSKQVERITDTVTNEVVREVPKEIQKIVTVPADIPAAYVKAMLLYEQMTNATFVLQKRVLFKMKDVRVDYLLGDAVKQVVSEDEVRAKFELTLRRNHVPIKPDSDNRVMCIIDGTFDQQRLCYCLTCSVAESQLLLRDGEFHYASVIVWDKGGSLGLLKTDNPSEGLLNEVEKESELFANDYLSANPKPQ
jgi:hypothetical protein